MFDYEILRFVWWILIGVLLIGFTVTDGFDMGVGVLLRVIGRNDTERRIMINAIAPHWDGNRYGLSPRVVHCSQHGRWSMRQHSPVSISQ